MRPMFVVLNFHHPHRTTAAWTVPFEDHREEDTLFFGQMIDHGWIHRVEMGTQPVRAGGVITVAAFDLLS
jgi:hypothetical protein